MKNVLIIGKNSYIGKSFKYYIDENLYEDINITMIGASDGSWRNMNFEHFDTVLLLSAIVHQMETRKNIDLYYKINHKLAVEIATFAKVNSVKHFIFMSTASVYNPKTTRVTLKTKPDPKTHYGCSKLLAENDIIKLISDDFKISIVRPPMIYGVGCKGNYSKLKRLARILPIFPEIHNLRSMINVNILCKYLYKVIKEERQGYFYPQDSEYADTCNLYVNLRKDMGKKTLLTNWFNGLIMFFINYNGVINKLFTDFYYDIKEFDMLDL